MFADIMQQSTKTSFLIKDLLGDVLIKRDGKCLQIQINVLYEINLLLKLNDYDYFYKEILKTCN